MKLGTILFLIIFSHNAYCQNSIKLNPKMIIGVAFRPNSIVLEKKIYTRNPLNFPIRIGTQGLFLFIDLTQKIYNEKLSVQFSNYFTLARFSGLDNIASSPAFANQIKFKRDHFVDFIYSLNSPKRATKFLLGVGFGFMNNGTKFKTEVQTGSVDSLGNPLYRNNVNATLRFKAPRLLLGLEKEKYNGFLILHGVPDPEIEQYPTIWLELKIGYKFTPFKKGVNFKNIFRE